jgi:hypothetical protein
MQLSLAESQYLLSRLISAPNGVEEGLRAEGNLPPEGIGGLIGGDLRLSAAARIEIYANMYFYRLLDAIKEDFPATLKVLGELNFHNLITGYLIEHPPSQPSITETSRHLGEFAENCGLHGQFPFSADLIRLEGTLVEVFLAPDATPLSLDELRAIPTEQWGSLRMTSHPATRLVDCRWNVDDVLCAVEHDHSVPAAVRGA